MCLVLRLAARHYGLVPDTGRKPPVPLGVKEAGKR